MSTYDLNIFAGRIREARASRGLTLQALADKLGTSTSTIANYERGKNGPKPHNLLKIAEALNTSRDYLVGRSDSDKSTDQVDEDMQFHPKLEEKLQQLMESGGFESRKECLADLIRNASSSTPAPQKPVPQPGSLAADMQNLQAEMDQLDADTSDEKFDVDMTVPKKK